MIKLENHRGTIYISHDYFAKLVGKAASECFGVAGMVPSGATQGFRELFVRQDSSDKGVVVRQHHGDLDIDLHIVVTYGLNISAIVKSICHKVRYTVEQATGLSVTNVNVCVDSMKVE